MTRNTTKTTSILMTSVLVMSLSLSPLAMENIFAYATCDWTQGNHCYAKYHNTHSNNYGIRADIKHADIDEGTCTSVDKDLAANAIWMVFPNDDWIEIGMGQGRFNSSCHSSDIFYDHVHEDSSSTVDTDTNLGSPTVGTTYELKISRTSTSGEWRAYKDSSITETHTFNYNTGEGQAGAEITSTSATIDETVFDDVERQTTQGGSWSNWSILNSAAQYEDSPPYRDHCGLYWHFITSTDSGDTC